MIKHNQDGSISAVTLSLGITIVLLIAAISFAAWAFSGRQDYKNNTDQKIADAVTIAKQKEDSAKDVVFAETEKNPFKTYEGPEAYGSVRLQYPKTWSGYVDSTGGGTAFVDGYFYPGVVPAINNQSSVFALRFQVINLPYSQALANLSSEQQNGKVTVEAYALPKVPKAVGVKASGTFLNGKAGVEVLLPLRNQTLQLSTEGTQFTPDFEKNILPNFTFSP